MQQMETVKDVLAAISKLENKENIKGKERYGINIETCFGLSVPQIRALAKEIGKNHKLAIALWKTDIHEARHIAAMIADPKEVTEKLMEQWVKDFNSWDIVDGCCSSLFRKTPYAYAKAMEWCERKEEYVRRSGFSMMATLAVHDKKEADAKFEQFFHYIYKFSDDERNFVRKSVNWSLRQIGKRNERLCKKAIKLAKEIRLKEDKASKWIATDALRELEKYLDEGKISNVGTK